MKKWGCPAPIFLNSYEFMEGLWKADMAERTCTVQDYFIKLGIRPHMHLWEISISLLNNVIVRPTKIMKIADKKWAHFQKTKYSKNQKSSKDFICKRWSPSKIFFTEKKNSERFRWFLMPKNDFESTNFSNFEKVLHNFGRSDDDTI